MANIGKLNLDIRVQECSSCKNLVVADHSYYLTDPEKPHLQITLPGYSKSVTFDFNASQINIYNSYSLGLSRSSDSDKLLDLPDGLYILVYMICPYEDLFETVYHIRQCKAWCRFDEYLTHIFDSCLDLNSDLTRDLQHVEWLLKGAESFSKQCDPDKAISLHRKALELLDNIKCQLGL